MVHLLHRLYGVDAPGGSQDPAWLRPWCELGISRVRL